MRVFTCRRPKYWLSPLMFSPDGRCIAGSKDPACPTSQVLYVWDTTGGPNELHSTGLLHTDFAFMPDGGILLNRGAAVWRADPGTWREFFEDSFLNKFEPHAFSSDGRLALAETHDL